MTPEELRKLDAECCEFVGLEPKRESRCECDEPLYGWMINREQRDAQCTAKVTTLTYPPVSTSWEAAGRLMDALKARCVDVGDDAIMIRISVVQAGYLCRIFAVRNREYRGDSDSGPLALALAVCEFARASKTS